MNARDLFPSKGSEREGLTVRRWACGLVYRWERVGTDVEIDRLEVEKSSVD